MKRIITPSEMREMDRASKMPPLVLMENAGKGIADDLIEMDLDRFVILVGRGNNGGDGMVVARWLSRAGKDVTVLLFEEPEKLSGEAKHNYELLLHHPVEIERFEGAIPDTDVIVDALFGIGFRGRLEGHYRDAVELANLSDALRVAVDIPSGVNGLTGEVEGVAFDAHITYTFAAEKLGHHLFEGKLMSGEVVVIDIGIEDYLYEDKGFLSIEDEDVLELLPSYAGWENKGDRGRLLIVAGSRDFTGAPLLNAAGSLSMGAGYTYLAVPESLYPHLIGRLPEVILIPLKDEDGYLYSGSFDSLMERGLKFDAVAFGSGVGRREGVRDFARKILNLDVPMVIDADGIWAVSDMLEELGEDVILTPHPGELAGIVGLKPHEVDRRRVDVVLDYAKKYNHVLLLKGSPTLVVQKEERYLNDSGDVALARAGSGDVLTGMIGALLAQDVLPVEAAALGAFLHGRAGEMGDEFTLTPSRIPDALRQYIESLYEEC